jgi:hypothetical protein
MLENSAHLKQWLSGSVFYSYPPVWSFRSTPGGFEIAPAAKPLTIATIAALIFSIAIGIIAVVAIPRDAAGLVITSAILIAAVLLAAVMLALFIRALREHRKGPHLLYSPTEQTLTLPRQHRAFPQSELIGWRVVSGNWIGPADKRTRYPDAVSELHLIVKSPTGPIAYAIVGWCTVPLTETLQQIAQQTALPLEIINQDEGVERSYSISH